MTSTGPRRALVVGIDYPGTYYALNGCVNDAHRWRDTLLHRRFAVHELTDAQATRAAILDTLRTLVTGAKAGDALVMVYSGHGTNVRDTDGDEADGRDEALCPVDMETAGLIVDDDLYAILAQLPPRVGFTLIADSCYSGTVTRSADFSAMTQRNQAVAGLVNRLGAAAQGEPLRTTRRARYLAAPRAALEATNSRRAVTSTGVLPRPFREAGAWATISACRPDEVSYESEGADGQVGGHFTVAATAVLAESGPSLTHAGLVRRALARMGGAAADQHPTFDGAPGTEKRTLVTVPAR